MAGGGKSADGKVGSLPTQCLPEKRTGFSPRPRHVKQRNRVPDVRQHLTLVTALRTNSSEHMLRAKPYTAPFSCTCSLLHTSILKNKAVIIPVLSVRLEVERHCKSVTPSPCSL